MKRRLLSRRRLETWQRLVELIDQLIALVDELHDLDTIVEPRRRSRAHQAPASQLILPFETRQRSLIPVIAH